MYCRPKNVYIILSIAFLLILCFFFFSVCRPHISELGGEVCAKTIVVAETRHYKVVCSDSQYYYYIFDCNHTILKHDGPFSKQPHLSMVEEHLLKVSVQTGTGISTNWGYYYDVESGKISPTFYGIYDEYAELVVYLSADGLVVQNIFSKEKFYQKITTFEYPLSTTVEPFKSVSFVNEGRSLKIVYFSGEDYREIDAILPLAVQDSE